MCELSADQQRVLTLAIEGGCSQTEIAERLGLPLGTVKTHARRGLVRLRELLGVRRRRGARLQEWHDEPIQAPGDDRRDELRADRALFGLTDAEQRELAVIRPRRAKAVTPCRTSWSSPRRRSTSPLQVDSSSTRCPRI